VSQPGSIPSWLLVKINPVLAAPRTHREVVEAPSLESLKARLDGALSNLV